MNMPKTRNMQKISGVKDNFVIEENDMIFETHAHYDDEAFEADREELLDSMRESGIGRIVNACASVESLKETAALMERYPFVYGAFGIHPDDADKMTEETLKEIRRLCQLPKAVAIGEIGLDYYWNVRWNYPLFLICEGDGTGVSGYGTLSGDRRRGYIQECKEAEGSSRVCTAQPDRSGDRQSVSEPGTKSRKKK